MQSCKVTQVAVTSNFEQLIQLGIVGCVCVCVYFLVCFGLAFVYSGVHIGADPDSPELARENWPSSSGSTSYGRDKEYIKPTSK